MTFEQELRILRKYAEKRLVDEEDQAIIDELETVGFIHKGYSFSYKKLTAKTTTMGRLLI